MKVFITEKVTANRSEETYYSKTQFVPANDDNTATHKGIETYIFRNVILVGYDAVGTAAHPYPFYTFSIPTGTQTPETYYFDATKYNICVMGDN